jgi:hypothetical protein
MFTKTDATALAAAPGTEVGISTVVAVQPSFRYKTTVADVSSIPQLPLQDMLFLHPKQFSHPQI